MPLQQQQPRLQFVCSNVCGCWIVHVSLMAGMCPGQTETSSMQTGLQLLAPEVLTCFPVYRSWCLQIWCRWESLDLVVGWVSSGLAFRMRLDRAAGNHSRRGKRSRADGDTHAHSGSEARKAGSLRRVTSLFLVAVLLRRGILKFPKALERAT